VIKMPKSMLQAEFSGFLKNVDWKGGIIL